MTVFMRNELNKMKKTKYLVLFTLFASNLVDQPAPEISIDQGKLVGKISADGTYFEYLGIPYASTSFETRFQAPLPPTPWEGIFRATDDSYSCPQNFAGIGVAGTEDCLKLNIYVPAKAKNLLPVMVFVHGGAFTTGSGGKYIYSPEFLVRHDVILVTINYRLGPLGFICLGIKEAPGNAGLKDQVVALKWIKKNIKAFGGDPDNVTVFGQSAGAVSVSFLMASNTTNGLFQKAILQSGSSLSNWAFNREPVWVASLIAQQFGYNTSDPYQLYEIFSKMPINELLSKSPKKPYSIFHDTELLYIPCIEKPLPGVEPFILDLPYNIIANKPKDIPVIIGTNSNEGLFLAVRETQDTVTEKNEKYVFASDLEFESHEEAHNISEKFKEIYFGNEKVTVDMVNKISDFITELYFEVPGLMETEELLKIIKSPIYNYYFDYAGNRNILKYFIGLGNEPGACHVDELMYLFKARIWPFTITKDDQVIIDWMTKFWTNFAKYSNPTPDFEKEVPVKWKPSTKDKINLLYIDKNIRMGPIPHSKTYKMWKDVYKKHRKTYLEKY